MKALIGLFVFTVAVVLGVEGLQSETQYRAKPGAVGSHTTIRFDVRVGHYEHTEEIGASNIWQTCLNMIPWDDWTEPLHVGSHRYQASIWPSLSRDPVRKLTGCLDDLILDGVRADVVSVVGDS